MKKVIRIEHLDCANCAAKLERALQQVAGVTEASVSFMTQKIVIKGEEAGFDQVLENVKATIKKIDPAVGILD